MYQVQFTAAGHRLFKKLAPDIKAEIVSQAKLLASDPYRGEQLHEKYRKFRSLHISFNGVAYRIIYQVQPAQESVLIYLADKRENIYKRLAHIGV